MYVLQFSSNRNDLKCKYTLHRMLVWIFETLYMRTRFSARQKVAEIGISTKLVIFT